MSIDQRSMRVKSAKSSLKSMFKTLKLEDHADALNITDEIAVVKSPDIKGLIRLKVPENCLIFK